MIPYKLAIVIPAYKPDFLSKTLESISKQTNKSFRLYIGDDNSPADLYRLVEPFEQSIDICYKKFSNNLGASSIVSHWTRCIELTGQEEWIWLFGDDDIMPVDAVERFYDFILKNKNYEIIRFNLSVINENDLLIDGPTNHPLIESSLDFAMRRLNRKCMSTVVEYIFSKKIYKEKMGFEEYPLGWASDDATWIKFAEETGILTIDGMPVCWRYSGKNISSRRLNSDVNNKIEAGILFVSFLKQRFDIHKETLYEWLNYQFELLPRKKMSYFSFIYRVLKSEMFSFGFILQFYLKRKIKTLFNA